MNVGCHAALVSIFLFLFLSDCGEGSLTALGKRCRLMTTLDNQTYEQKGRLTRFSCCVRFFFIHWCIVCFLTLSYIVSTIQVQARLTFCLVSLMHFIAGPFCALSLAFHLYFSNADVESTAQGRAMLEARMKQLRDGKI